MNLQKTIRTLYKKLIDLYPRDFKEKLGESMQQTFTDQYDEIQNNGKSELGFVTWMFIETGLGIFREHLLLISPGDIMNSMLKTLGSSMLVSFLLTLPLIIMEIVNRRNYNEEFPFTLFFGIWSILFAISLILLPIIQGRSIGNHDMANPESAQGNTPLVNPKLSVMISVGIFLTLLIFTLLNFLGLISMDQLLNSPNAEGFYVFGIPVISRLIMLVLASLPIVAAIIAGGPIVRTLRAGGSLFAHPVNLIIVAFILSALIFGLTSFIIDQWPCFMGVPVCD